jgi:hypothetical protein
MDDDNSHGGGGGDKCKRNKRNSGEKKPTTKFLRISKETVERMNSMVNELHKTRKWSKLKKGKSSAN